MAKPKSTEVVTKLVDILTPLSADERRRAIGASLLLLGDEPVGSSQAPSKADEGSEGMAALPIRAQSWMKQNSISMEELQQVFHIDGESTEAIVSEVPGKTDKEKTYSAYVLAGISRLRTSGNPSFDDKSARALCESLGCLNAGNHATYLGSKQKEFTGSKEKGWTLTAPGLKRGAELVKELSKPQQ